MYGPADPPPWPADDARVAEVTDILERLMIRAVKAGALGFEDTDDQFVALLDATIIESSPHTERVLAILEMADRGGCVRSGSET